MGLLQMVAENKTAETMKKKKGGEAPKCGVDDHTMKPSQDSQGNPIWICPLDPTHPTKPRGG